MTPLRRRMIEDMQVRNLAPHTQRSSVEQISQFARHFGKSPDARPRRHPGLPDPPEPREAALGQLHACCRRRHPLPLQGHAQARLEHRRRRPDMPQATAAAGGAEPRRGQPLPRCRRDTQAPRHPDHLLRRRSAHFRSGPPGARRHRQPAHGHSRRGWQRAEGPLRHAFAQASRSAAGVLARSPTEAVAVPRRSARTADHSVCRRLRVPESARQPASKSPSRHILCATPSPSTCSRPAPTCAPSSCCSATAA